MTQHKAVVFGLPQPDGSIKQVSNDPYWQAEQLLAGQKNTQSAGDDELEQLRAENEALKAQLNGPPPLPETVTDDDDDEEDDTEDEFAKLKAKELKGKASELGVDIKGLTKVGEVRQALRDHVAAQG